MYIHMYIHIIMLCAYNMYIYIYMYARIHEICRLTRTGRYRLITVEKTHRHRCKQFAVDERSSNLTTHPFHNWIYLEIKKQRSHVAMSLE